MRELLEETGWQYDSYTMCFTKDCRVLSPPRNTTRLWVLDGEVYTQDELISFLGLYMA